MSFEIISKKRLCELDQVEIKNDFSNKKQKTRHNLSQHLVSKLITFGEQYRFYPPIENMIEFSQQYNVSLKKIKNWFNNYRKRKIPREIRQTPFNYYFKYKSGQRGGIWTEEEIDYTHQLIEAFRNGLIENDDIVYKYSLRQYLGYKLNCLEMRITKKFSGENSLRSTQYQCNALKESHPDLYKELIMKVSHSLHTKRMSFLKRIEMTEEEIFFPISSSSSSSSINSSSFIENEKDMIKSNLLLNDMDMNFEWDHLLWSSSNEKELDFNELLWNDPELISPFPKVFSSFLYPSKEIYDSNNSEYNNEPDNINRSLFFL